MCNICKYVYIITKFDQVVYTLCKMYSWIYVHKTYCLISCDKARLYCVKERPYFDSFLGNPILSSCVSGIFTFPIS